LIVEISSVTGSVPGNLRKVFRDFQIRGAQGDVFGGIERIVEDGDGYVFKNGPREFFGGIANELAGVGMKFVVDPTVAGLPPLNHMLRYDAHECQFSFAKQRQIALLA
jgi:hypothetical protein